MTAWRMSFSRAREDGKSDSMSNTPEETRRARGLRVRRIGTVVSKSGDKTIEVRSDYRVIHPKYGKYIKRFTTLPTHDEKNEAKTGDLVEVAACRRMSKRKCWHLVRIIGGV